MKVGRNDPCPCGSGKKYKHCCYAKDSVKHEPDPEQEELAQAGDAAEGETHAEHGDAEHGDHAEHPEHKKGFDPEKGRGRFHGNQRGGSSSFSPRVFRGSQRGH